MHAAGVLLLLAAMLALTALEVGDGYSFFLAALMVPTGVGAASFALVGARGHGYALLAALAVALLALGLATQQFVLTLGLGLFAAPLLVLGYRLARARLA